MPTGLSYADAVRLLDGSPGGGAEHALGGALLVASAATGGTAPMVLSLFDVKNELMRVSRWLVTQADRITRGHGRVDRSARLRAAHSVIVVANLFGALDELDLPIAPAGVAMNRAEQAGLIAGEDPGRRWLDNLLAAAIPAPGPALSYDDLLGELRRWYAWHGNRLLEFVQGLAVWDELDDTRRRRMQAAFRDRLPEVALARYESDYLQLAGELPEFAFWSWRAEQRATAAELRQVGIGLRELEALLRRMTSGSALTDRRAALAAAYRDALHGPITGEDQHTVELTMPSLGEIYVDPRFVTRVATVNDNPAEDSWWDDVPVRHDFPTFMAAHLTSPEATQAPLVLLGQPGAGKSALTRVLAARLPAEDFMPILVPLREVPADYDVQGQIEHAARAATGDGMSWKELAESAGGALPVVLLDGFDELLQALGVSQSNYLQRIAAFQRREAVQGRPVAVVVTTRTAVADRARLAEHSVVVRIEPFDDRQVSRWLSVWNETNRDGFARRGVSGLPAEVAWRYQDLAGHPLLLVMLALYDAHDNALQRAHAAATDGSDLNRAQLYERLLSTFASREIHRSDESISDADLSVAVEEELLRLSVVAFAMFNRSRGWATEPELNRDFAGLAVTPPGGAAGGDLRRPPGPGRQMIARFFFVQGVPIEQHNQRLHTFSFLHGTFGEFLVARLITRVLHDLADREAAGSLRLRPAPVEDPLLYSLLSFAPLCTQGSTVLLFLAELFAAEPARRADVGTWVLRAFHKATTRLDVPHDDYLPVAVPAGSRLVRFTVNLLLLRAVCHGHAEAAELFPGAADPAGRLGRLASSWQAVLSTEDWGSLLDATMTRRSWDGQRRNAVVSLAGDGERPEAVDALWVHDFAAESHVGRFGAGHGFNQWVLSVRIERAQQLRTDQGDDMLRHALTPVLDRMPETVDAFAVHAVGDAESIAHSVQRVLLSSALADSADTLVAAYDRCVFAVTTQAFGPGHLPKSASTLALLLEMLGRDASRLPVPQLCRWLEELARSRQFRTEHLPATLNCALVAAPEAAEDRQALDALVRSLVRQVHTTLQNGGPAWDRRARLLLWICLHEAGAGPAAVDWLDPPDAAETAELLRHDRALGGRLRALQP
ncbi:NACHT domain-containing protein [Dactylosporangium sp. AC04546]|uniref:NACHT domain-containing protein n=1 Tax=Dactylosporangium sp. AC04546 TaxID=2862460 RepID=UPI001EDD8381|nr:NACHT domain-containing protein [Dactylosporangium sp. AC04546]WVK88455.1 NACHT domain-containing protein [Dactylosporangium sp. AC04546]